ncbi:hypothetical protein EDB81DRAFT_702787 [Dactylonectria macrodidyma]|uniref:Zn(2)-C6 fungal-type domain-containing protein n=1 Tax=Dactylonectria macrodidyma TaxID=307937 RepID=A0A9P9D7Q0_9HYPO|nr:hypothetical protein EDB81DRAFT_702787 [Dactylonectria macrodidyma]
MKRVHEYLDEDGTEISDRVQLKITESCNASRRYRKKLKHRRKDLELRAGSSNHTNSKRQSQTSTKLKRSSSSPSKSHNAEPVILAETSLSQGQYTPPMEEEGSLYHLNSYNYQERSQTPPLFCPTYPAPDEILLHPYGTAQLCTAMTTAQSDPNYLAASTVPTTLPSMTYFRHAVERESCPSNGGLGPHMAYGLTLNMDHNAPSPFSHQSNPQTPPLSPPLDLSADCYSEADYGSCEYEVFETRGQGPSVTLFVQDDKAYSTKSDEDEGDFSSQNATQLIPAPNKPRAKMPLACLSCRGRKVRCNVSVEVKGPCSNCERHGQECVTQLKKRPEARMSLVCLNCRGRKVRCDVSVEVKGPCSNCERHGQECVTQ